MGVTIIEARISPQGLRNAESAASPQAHERARPRAQQWPKIRRFQSRQARPKCGAERAHAAPGTIAGLGWDW
jgi:hypothetical protein